MPNPSCFSVLASARARALPWIVHWHSDIPADAPDWRLRAGYRLYRPFEQALLKRARAIVATSGSYLRASAALSRWHDKARVIPLGVADAQPMRSTRDHWPSGTGTRWLAVGRLSHYKGFDVLIDALAKVPDARALIVGEGECSTALRDQALASGVAERIRFGGALDDADLLDAYASADAFVLPSINRGEAFGLVLLEAMRASLPVVASAVPGSGIGEVVADESSGILVAPSDAAALAAAMRRLDDAALRQRMGSAGRQRWSDTFTLERSASQVLALYRELTT